ncbi:MAG: FAD-dependent oxidoreductase, partial [Candidatus Brocadiae bacterium]|nr:FAD-dependent oxidoreductase [Candidatus Brocadiia bacterium]
MGRCSGRRSTTSQLVLVLVLVLESVAGARVTTTGGRSVRCPWRGTVASAGLIRIVFRGGACRSRQAPARHTARGRRSMDRVVADVCVIGGGMAGLAAAVTAARQGVKVALVQDRPALGGNASSEVRIHITGADQHGNRPFCRETGILEELRLENSFRNPQREYPVWDLILYDFVTRQPNLQLFLNAVCLGARMEGRRVRAALIEQPVNWLRFE